MDEVKIVLSSKATTTKTVTTTRRLLLLLLAYYYKLVGPTYMKSYEDRSVSRREESDQ